MKLGSVRDLESLKRVLKDPQSVGPDPAYWVFSGSTEQKWENLTIIASGKYNNEFTKTFGHYHPKDAEVETYHLIEGEGILLMQKKSFEGEVQINDKVEKVYLIQAKSGDEIAIKPDWGHSWSNVGQVPLLSFDDWRFGHQPSDYEIIEKMQGMAYYLVEEDGEVKAVPNPNYQDLPEPRWVSAQEFKELTD